MAHVSFTYIFKWAAGYACCEVDLSSLQQFFIMTCVRDPLMKMLLAESCKKLIASPLVYRKIDFVTKLHIHDGCPETSSFFECVVLACVGCVSEGGYVI